MSEQSPTYQEESYCVAGERKGVVHGQLYFVGMTLDVLLAEKLLGNHGCGKGGVQVAHNVHEHRYDQHPSDVVSFPTLPFLDLAADQILPLSFVVLQDANEDQIDGG